MQGNHGESLGFAFRNLGLKELHSLDDGISGPGNVCVYAKDSVQHVSNETSVS